MLYFLNHHATEAQRLRVFLSTSACMWQNVLIGGCVRNRNTNTILRGLSILFLAGALVLTITSLIAYSRQRNNYPNGMTIGGVPVDGLSPSQASQRLLEVYTSPIQANYGSASFYIDPGNVGFQIDMETMLAAADLSR